MDRLTKQDKELIYEYTDGEYSDICDYSQLRYDESQFKTIYKDSPEFRQTILDNKKVWEVTSKLEQLISEQPVKRNHIIRLENSFNNNVDEFKKGLVINWGIKSATRDKDFAHKIVNTSEYEEYIRRDRARRKNVEYRFNTSKSLDISTLSKYPNQQEELVFGSYKVVDVEHIESQYAESNPIKKTYTQIIEEYNLNVTITTSKNSGKTTAKFIFRDKPLTCPPDKLDSTWVIDGYDEIPNVIERTVVYLELLEQKKGSN